MPSMEPNTGLAVSPRLKRVVTERLGYVSVGCLCSVLEVVACQELPLCFSSMGPRTQAPWAPEPHVQGGGPLCGLHALAGFGRDAGGTGLGHACLTGLAAWGHRDALGQHRPHKQDRGTV